MPAGWYADPMGRHELRWWDGQQWSMTVSDGGAITAEAPGAPSAAPVTAPRAAPPARRTTPLLIAAVAGVAALVVGVLATQGDDDGGQVGGATTSATSSNGTTFPSSTVLGTTTVAPPTSVDTAFDSAALADALPTTADVPATWEQTADPTLDPQPATSGGYCDGPDAAARAIDLGATGRAWGPAWRLPDGGHFGVDAYAFSSAELAREYIEATGAQARGCADAPITFTADEADVGFLADDMGDGFAWDAVEASDATAGQFGDGTATMRATIETRYSTTVSGQWCTVNVTTLVYYVQYGTVVVEHWMDGEWGHTGLGGEPDYAHHPMQAELDAAVAVAAPALERHLSGLVGV